MKNKYINFTIVIISCLILIGCQSVKDGLTGKKTNNSDEFLIEKKNPLVMPPEYKKMPDPGNINTKKENTEDFSINQILDNQSKIKKSSSKKSQSNTILEDSIIKIIKEK